MLENSPVTVTIPVKDLQRASNFYQNILGLKIINDTLSDFGVVFKCGNETTIYLYLSEPSQEIHHPASFRVENIKETKQQLFNRGVVFEDVNIPGGHSEEPGIITQGNLLLAFFKDPDGNYLSLVQVIERNFTLAVKNDFSGLNVIY